MVSIGIHINKHGFGVAELSLNKNCLQFKGARSHFFNLESSNYDITLIEHLKILEEKYKDQPLRFCYSLPQDEVSDFSISLPFKEKFKILKTLPFEIEEQSPFNPKKVFYDARVSKIQGNSSDLVCFVTPEGNVHDFLQQIKPIKTEPYLLSTEASALANTVEDWHTHQLQDNKNKLYIHIGLYETIVLFFKKGSLKNVSNINWGMLPIIKKIEQKYKISFEAAKNEFLEKSFILSSDDGFTKDQVSFSNLIKQDISSFIQQLRLLNLSFQEKDSVLIEDCVLFGPGSVIKNLSAFLSIESPYKFSKLTSIPHLKEFDLLKPKNQTLLVALGLAMEGFKKPPYTAVNFFHSFKKESFLFFPKKWRQTISVTAIILSLFFCFSWLRNQETKNLLFKMDDVFLAYTKKIILVKSPDKMNLETSKKYLENKDRLKNIEKVIEKKIQKINAIDQLKIVSQIIQAENQWELQITNFKARDFFVSMEGNIKPEFEPVLKERLQKIATSQIQNKAKPQDAAILQDKTDSNSQNESGSQNKADTSQDNSLKNQDLQKGKENLSAKAEDQTDKSKKNKNDLEDIKEANPSRLKRFSYQFKIKGLKK